MRIRRGGTQSLADAFSPHDNGLNVLRLVFAFLVLVSHSFPLGFGRHDPGGFSRYQVGLGEVGLIGFFVVSGFLVARSADRLPLGRYLWHRALRIMPGFWVCLIVTAFVFAPAVALIERGSVAGVFGGPDGAVSYVVNNWFLLMRQYGIDGLLLDTPYGRMANVSTFDGSLWTLVYETLCYVMIAAFAVLGVLRRARWMVLAVTLAGTAVMVADLLRAPQIPGPQGAHGPVFGIDALDAHPLIYLTYVFLLGTVGYLYRDRVPFGGGHALAALVVCVASAQLGGFAVLGYPAFAYLVFWLAIRLPARVRAIGRKHDYSYGLYIYAYPAQQILAVIGVASLGMAAYVGIATAATLLLAVPSWHLIERPAMRLKRWRPAIRRTPADRPLAGPVDPVPEVAAAEQA